MTIKDIENYAKEKKMPKRGLDDMIQRLRAEHGECVDDMLGAVICAEIDRKAGYWEYVRGFLEMRRAERERKKLTTKEAPYIAEIAPIDDSAPLTPYQVYSSPAFPNQYCVMLDGELRPLSDLQGKYTIITSAKPGAVLPDTSNISPIKRMRETCGLTQKQLAELIGCTQKDISRYETGTRNPSAQTIQKLARVFNCTMEELTILLRHFKGTKEKSPQ